MKRLIIDTSHRAGFVAMGDDIRRFEDSRKMSDQLAEIVQQMWDAPDEIAVGRGPGSFTGMRVGISLARGLAMGSGIPLVGFCSLEAHFPMEDGPFVAAFDARAGGVYFLKGEKLGDQVEWEEPQVGPPEMLQGLKVVSPDGSLAAEESVPQLEALRFTENLDALYMRKTQAERNLEA